MFPPVLLVRLMVVTVLGFTALQAHSQDSQQHLDRGAQLFAHLCASCHGETGAGDGPVASLLDPRPRDFGLATFHLVSTDNRLPSDEDLLDTLRLGMVGTAMPGWGHLPEDDLSALVAFLRETMVQRRVDKELRRSSDRTPKRRAEAERDAREALRPGLRVPIGPPPPPTPGRVARGREVWVSSCAECHGEDGRGGVRDDLRDSRGAVSLPRDMTRGLFRGSDEPVELGRRIALGMPGTAMPSFELPDEDLWAVVHYVRSLVMPGAQQEMFQVRRTLAIPRAKSSLREQSDINWQFVPQARLPLMPYVWDGQAVGALVVQGVHDGDRLAVRVRWDDPLTGEAAGWTEELEPPQLTLKFSADPEPPLFSGHQEGLQIWSWWASQADDAGRDGAARGVHADHRWEVVFLDALDELDGDSETLRLQFSVRTGGPKTRAMTLWHALELAR